MRQTSRAVALLLTLESARSTITPIAISGDAKDLITATNVAPVTMYPAATTLTSRVAPWQALSNTILTSMSFSSPVIGQATTVATSSGSVFHSITASSPCVPCILGGAVWCSRTYSYFQTGANYNCENTTATVMMQSFIATDEATTTAGTVDGGACCGTEANFKSWTGIIGTAGQINASQVGSTQTAGTTSGGVCNAFNTVITSGAAANTWELTGTAYKSWWCSNGLYSKVTGTGAGEANNVQPYFISDNQRTEFALIGCPQLKAKCGVIGTSALTSIVTNLSTTTAAATVIDVKQAAGPTVNDKCTWVAKATLAAPTFTIGKTNDTTPVGLVSLNWQVHTVEYNGLELSLDTSTAGFTSVSSDLNKGNYVPIAIMPAVKYATLRTWYGVGTATWNTNWNAPYQNVYARASTGMDALAGQYYGNVASFPSSTSNTDYGTGFDGRVVRYFPAKQAQASWAAGNALYGASGSFATANSAYTTAKTTWNAYVAILAKNAKADAFAAAFSPPKAPTVPPLPSRPWVPGAYGGLYFLTNQKYAKMHGETNGSSTLTAANQPTNQEFWLTKDAAWNGGWGTFTAQILTFRDGWSKSFGTIGYSKDSAALNMSAVHNYKWTCSGNTGSASTVCDQTYDAAGLGSASSANGTNLYVAVSIWSLGNQVTTGLNLGTFNNFAGTFTGAGSQGQATKNDFRLTFTGKAWSEELVKLTSFATPTQPAAASSLSGIAGAQALAASAAAALAAAAALY